MAEDVQAVSAVTPETETPAAAAPAAAAAEQTAAPAAGPAPIAAGDEPAGCVCVHPLPSLSGSIIPQNCPLATLCSVGTLHFSAEPL